MFKPLTDIKLKMKIAICSTIALAALCGLALADLFDDDYYGSWGGYGGGMASWGGAGYGGGSWGGAGYGGGKQYIPVPVGGGAKGGSGFAARKCILISFHCLNFIFITYYKTYTFTSTF